MKTFISIIFCAALLFTSCSSNQSTEEQTEKSVDSTDIFSGQSLESGDLEEAKNCDEFIDQYEEWSDDYIELLEKYMKNPMDATLSKKFMEQAEKATFWMNQWNSKLIYCASQEKYQKRFDEITDRADKKLKELGIE